ncbi:hypothetical protein AB0I81_59200 [Nonomuraea sp. NPDC050404]|uniref:hypothetical protein n=1 Tax=Nonomuraea sp. NPDC050404 TaxID=3155783 RepID=UPI0033EAD0B0
MAFLSRLFNTGDPPTEREQARRLGMRDARRHPLGEFTDPEFQPAYVTEVRARVREEVTQVDRRLAATRTALLERALGERETILRELSRSDTRSQVNGHAVRAVTPRPATDRPRPPEPAPHEDRSPYESAREDVREADPFISIAESRVRRAEARRRAVVEESDAGVQRARARIEHLTQEWESALIERDHEVEAVHARAERLIAAYKSGVLRSHPRKEEIPPLWKGEVIAMNAGGETAEAASGREEIGRILREVEHRIELWHAQVMPAQLHHDPAPGRLPHDHGPAQLAQSNPDATSSEAGEPSERDGSPRSGDSREGRP